MTILCQSDEANILHGKKRIRSAMVLLQVSCLGYIIGCDESLQVEFDFDFSDEDYESAVNSLNGKLYPDPTERGATASDGT